MLTLVFISEPQFYCSHLDYHIDESDEELQISVMRAGSDLSQPSSVTVRSRQIDPISAEGNYKFY
jgi:hypothetical protein